MITNDDDDDGGDDEGNISYRMSHRVQYGLPSEQGGANRARVASTEGERQCCRVYCVLRTLLRRAVRRKWELIQIQPLTLTLTAETEGLTIDDIHESVAAFSVVSIDSRPKRLNYLNT